MENLSEKQKAIVEATEDKIIVISAASSGKTQTLTARIKYLLENGVNPKELVAITFTNLAAEEIRERVGAIAKDCFIGTVHSYCNYLLVSGGINTKDILDEEKFDELFERILQNPQCVKFVDYLLLDEAQDSSDTQFQFLLDFVDPAHYMLVGDARQTIYRFNGASPDIFIRLMKDPNVTVYKLDENYRNGTNILDFAKLIIRQNGADYIDDSIPMRSYPGQVITVEYSPEAIARTIKSRGNFGKWFILCRTNAQMTAPATWFKKLGVPYSIVRRADFTSNHELHEKMQEDTVKIMTIHGSKGLENDNVVVIGAGFGYRGKTMDQIENVCVNYVAATRARDLLVWTHITKYKAPKEIDNWE